MGDLQLNRSEILRSETKRNAYWDNVKWVLIALVVIGHFVAPYAHKEWRTMAAVFLFIYTFHMPLFVFISGLFIKNTVDSKPFRIERVFSFITLYLLFKVVKYILLNFFLDKSYDYHVFVANDLSWYMLCMAIWICLTHRVKNITWWKMMIISIVAAFLIGFDAGTDEVMAIERVVNYFPFFLAGYYLNPEKVQKFVKQKKMVIIGFAGII